MASGGMIPPHRASTKTIVYLPIKRLEATFRFQHLAGLKLMHVRDLVDDTCPAGLSGACPLPAPA